MTNEPSNNITEYLEMIRRHEDASAAELRGKSKLKTTKRNSRSRKNGSIFSEEKEGTEEEPSGIKKLDHNAKERIRRMKLNASYLALRSLLPDSRRSKKKWSAPAIVDRVLKYIPELENEVEALRCKKENVITQTEIAQKKNIIHPNYENPTTVSLNRVNREEAVVQVCMSREEDDESRFTKLVQSVEDEGICIRSASSLDISQTRICYHLHIQVCLRDFQQTNNTTSESDQHFEELRNMVISWLK